MKLVLYLIGLVFLVIVASFLIPVPEGDGDPGRNLPWQITVDGQGGSTVFGLQPGRSTLADLKAVFGNQPEVAIIARPDELGAVEAYYSEVTLGFVQARLVAALDVDPATVEAMRERALKAKHMESTTRKITLHPDDLAQLEKAAVKSLAVIPAANLDEAAIVQRFGPPAERLPVGEKQVHLFYPQLGLDVTVNAEGKEALQYVAPRDFALLREPLREPPGAGGG
ncbi:MAG: hypothetical protein LBV49_12520 [Azonexus sp.]|jgi:hypothetical protein|nr:hypothetical protein [Azonexus sp.]